MVKPGMDVFIQINPDSKKRVLSPGTSIALTEDGVTAEFEDGMLELQEGQELLFYFEHRQQFMQQAARVQTLLEEEPKRIVEFELIGDPVSAESRQNFRVSTLGSEISCTVGEESDCPVLDVSATGFSVWAKQERSIGDIVDIVLCYEGRELSGQASVQSAQPHKGELKRYGLHAVRDGGDEGLQSELIRVSMSLQRAQLARLSGS